MKPEFVKINDKKYKINTDFRVALECNKIAEDNSIGEYEKILAIIYKLFGDEGLKDNDNYSKLLELGQKYLLCGKETNNNNEEPNMDFEQDSGYIKASFFNEYKIKDIWSIKYMHWWDFCDYINGLTENCVLNRVRYIRDYDMSDIKDTKEIKMWQERKKSVELKKKSIPLTERQKENINEFKKLAKLNN